MITVLESINLSTDFLSKKGIESPRMNAELLLADILKCKRLDLYLRFDKPLSDPELEKYRSYIKRRGSFEPLQYIIGKVEFYGLELKVNSSVLIPRPETELLVEKIIQLFQENKKLMILDIGCGSGNISIALAANLSDSEIFATDINEESLQIAEENAKGNKVSGRIKFLRHDILNEDLDIFQKFDVIVSNPPYVSKNNFSTLQREVREFEPLQAVTDYDDGFTFYRVISKKASTKLNTGGKLFFEVAQGQSLEVINIMGQNNFFNISVVKDYQNIERIVFGEIK